MPSAYLDALYDVDFAEIPESFDREIMAELVRLALVQLELDPERVSHGPHPSVAMTVAIHDSRAVVGWNGSAWTFHDGQTEEPIGSVSKLVERFEAVAFPEL